jgi:hypothetical protein
MATTHKVPSQAASGRDTFNDNLVGVQITDGTSQLTNTNFELDKNIPEKDSKKFKTNPFSEFLTLDTLNKETSSPTTQTQEEIDQQIRFKNAKNDAGRSLYGSLSSRILVSINRIISKFPAAFMVDKDNSTSTSAVTASEISYDISTNTTKFTVESSKTYNPFEIEFSKPNSNILPETDNEIRRFFSSYKKYVVELSGIQYSVVNYIEPNINKKMVLTIEGNPFTGSTYLENILVRPIDGITEEFFNGLDDLENQLLNRESNPLYTASFIVPRDSFDHTTTDLITVKYTWPTSKDGWNIKVTGSDYDAMINELSDLATEIDDYKSNLMVRFLSSPQLFEFDTEDKKMESVFQLYGQNFDKVKKYIDNIAFMRNISYDGINNLPDILLKNLAETLGLSTVNLFDEKKFEEILYTRHDTQYGGESMARNIIEAEYEFYRRLLANLSFIYKSKGTRSAINFFLRFLGAPEPLIKIEEHVYQVIGLPESKDLEGDIRDVIQGTKTRITGYYSGVTSGYTYEKLIETGTTTFTREGYPVDEVSGLPRKASNSITDIYFQKGSGWYDITLQHRSRDILDTENSILTGRTKTIKTKSRAYDYGEDYFDVFRTLPGLDTGYELENVVDNVKAHIVDDKSPIILNRKNIGVYLSPSRAIDYDIWKKSRDLVLTFGTETLYPQTGITFAEFLDKTIHSQIKNSHTIRYKKNYIALEDVYTSYVNSSGFTPYNFIDSHEFILKMSPYWVQVIEQIIPATTLWTGGNLIENNLFGRSKYKYNLGCQVKEIIQKLEPEPGFVQEVTDEIVLWDPDKICNIKFYPEFIIDCITYSGTLSSSYAIMSGLTSVPNLNAALYSDLYVTYNPDYTALRVLWKKALINYLDNELNVPDPVVSYEFFTNTDGIEMIKFSSYKNGPHECSIMDSLEFKTKVVSVGGCAIVPCNPDCSIYNITIDQGDINLGNGNVVYLSNYECGATGSTTLTYTTPQTFDLCIQATEGIPYLYIYTGASVNVPCIYSTAANTHGCCTGCTDGCTNFDVTFYGPYTVALATGNTIHANNTVYVEYKTCGQSISTPDNISTKILTGSTTGYTTYYNELCTIYYTSTGMTNYPRMYFYQNDIAQSIDPDNYIFNDTRVCCTTIQCAFTCENYTVAVDPLDLAMATGNTGHSNNTVYVGYKLCDPTTGDPTTSTLEFTTGGTYIDAFCNRSSSDPGVYFYQNDIQITGGVSSYLTIGDTCCDTGCTKPSGLVTNSLISSVIITGTTYNFYTGDTSEVNTAFDRYLISGGTITGYTMFDSYSVNLNERIYTTGQTNCSCSISDGIYWQFDSSLNNPYNPNVKLVTVINCIIYNIIGP